VVEAVVGAEIAVAALLQEPEPLRQWTTAMPIKRPLPLLVVSADQLLFRSIWMVCSNALSAFLEFPLRNIRNCMPVGPERFITWNLPVLMVEAADAVAVQVQVTFIDIA